MADDPVGHEAAVAAAGDADPRRVDLGICRQHRIGEVHEVFIVRFAVVAPDVHEPVVPAVAALGVAEEHKIAHGGPELHFVVEHRAVDRLGAAVDIQNRRVGLGRIEVPGQQHIAADLLAPALDGQGLIVRHILVLQDGVIEMTQLPDFTRGQVRSVQLLEAVVIEGHQKGLLRILTEGDAVDAALFAHHHGAAAVAVQAVQQSAILPGGDVIESAAFGLPALAAAVAAVAAHAAVHTVFLFPQHRQTAIGQGNPVHPAVFVETVALASGGQEPQLAAHGLELVQGQVGIVSHQGSLPGFGVQAVEPGAKQGHLAVVGAAGIIDHAVQAGKVVQAEQRLRDPPYVSLVRHGEQGGAALVNHAGAVEPEGNLVQNLVVLLLIPLLGHLGPLLLVHFVVIRVIDVHGAGGHPDRPDPLHPLGRKGPGEGVERFTAPEIQPVEAGELLLGFPALLFLFGADGREEQAVLVLPEIAALAAQIRQLPQGTVPEPEPAFIAVVLLAAVGDHKGRLFAAGGVFHVGKEPVIQEILQFNGLHFCSSCFFFGSFFSTMAVRQGRKIRKPSLPSSLRWAV